MRLASVESLAPRSFFVLIFLTMPPDRKALVFKALCVLEEAWQQSRHGAVPASMGLRFALAYLYAIGDRRNEHFDREPYDTFWQQATQRDDHGDTADGFGRSQRLTAAFNGIARASGMERDVALLQTLHDAVAARLGQ